ncbi:MAG: exo-alpha-sialidase [Salinibacter sp.]|uniref:exo-alpha-sialidase n=1 Tax=Salinibacter sp. TaxID=2065818 RepID=UPI0035D4CF47
MTHSIRPLPFFPSLILLGVLFLLAGTGCGTGADDSPKMEDVSPARQTAFRVRSNVDAGLNANAGWAGPLNESVSLPVEAPFRLRFEVETPLDAPFVERFRLQYRRNGGPWRPVPAADFPYAPSEVTARVSVVSTAAYEDLADAADLLDGSTAAYAGGAGLRLTGQAPALPDHGVQSEWEWPLVIRRYADGAVTNEAGDRFEFRMVDVKGRPLAADTFPTVTTTVPPRLLGGTYPETPSRLGPWEASDGSLYFLMEPAESYNKLMTVKSEDGGQTWREVDGAHRPATGDLEGFASAMHEGTIHMLHQIGDGVLHHSFHTSDHSTDPDTWAVRDDTVATPGEPPVQVTSITARSDGSLVGIYGGPQHLYYKIRSPEGTWGAETTIPSQTDDPLSGPQSVRGTDDTVHLAYTRRDGTAWYRRIRPDGSLTPPRQISSNLGTTETDAGSVLPLVHLPETNTTAILYRRADGTLWARRADSNGQLSAPVQVTERRVVQSAADSDQVGADAVAIASSVHVLFIENGTGHLYHIRSDEPGTWTPATLEVDSVNAQWVRGQPVRQGRAYGYVYDAGSNGGSGMNWYGEVPVGEQ